jgi:hypothetical protein
LKKINYQKEVEQRIDIYEKEIWKQILKERTTYRNEIIKYQDDIKILKQNLENEQLNNKILEEKLKEIEENEKNIYLKKEQDRLEQERIDNKQKELEQMYFNQLNIEQLEKRVKEIKEQYKNDLIKKEREEANIHINRIVYNNMIRSMNSYI